VATGHPIATPFAVALAIRAVAAVVSVAGVHGYLIPDESQYMELGKVAAAGHLTPAYWQGYGESLFHEAASFMWPLTILFWLFGAHVVLAALWSALFGALVAALTALLAGRILGRGWAAISGLVVAVFPSQILWSSVVLRESMVWAGLAAAAIGVASLARAERWQAVAGAVVLVALALLVAGYLRSWTFLGATWAAAVAVWFFRPARPVLARGLLLLVAVVVPIAPGLGPGGALYVHKTGGRLGYERAVLSLGAKSAFVHPKLVNTPTTPASGPGAGGTGTGGPGAGGPNSAKSPTTTTTQPVIPSSTPGEGFAYHSGLKSDLKALPTGVVAFVLRPFPWQHGGGISLDLAALEELLYYPLYVLGLIGAVAFWRRREVLAFPLLTTILVTAFAAEAEGNLGSAFRHRDQLFWAVALFATLGAEHLWERWRARHRARGETNPIPSATARQLDEPQAVR
jgi:hypothetical protein